LVEPGSALAKRLRLAAVGQETDMAQALTALGQDMQEQTAEELVGRQGQGLAAIALAAIAQAEAHLSAVDSQDAVVGDSHAVGRASEIVASLLRSCQRPLGIDDP
jgi:hypothetical protein